MTQVPAAGSFARRLRSLGAILTGIVVIFVTSTATDLVLHQTGVFPPPGQAMAAGLWLLATVYRCVFAVFGCWLAARMAPDRPMWHAMLLGIVGFVLSTLGTVMTWSMGEGFGPKWYPISLIVTSVPCAWLGGKLASKRALPSAGSNA